MSPYYGQNSKSNSSVSNAMNNIYGGMTFATGSIPTNWYNSSLSMTGTSISITSPSYSYALSGVSIGGTTFFLSEEARLRQENKELKDKMLGLEMNIASLKEIIE